jgi:hypothetical protein
MAKPKPLSKLFSQPNEELASIVTKARGLRRLSGRLRRLLGPPLSEHCGVANIAPGELVLYATTSAWAARLRLVATQIRAQLGPELGIDANKVQIKIRVLPPTHGDEETPHSTPPPLSARSAETLRTAADSLEDQELSNALARLARHVNTE